jgi:fructuronate reductase
VLRCDNLPANGGTAAQVVTDFADLRGGDLGDFVRREAAFPATMVDRIVPATTDDDRKRIPEATSRHDAWPVVTEPFTQWVIEDYFLFGRPQFELSGAEMIADVRPHELIKLRMLNSSHSMLAYLGYLAGYEFVNEAIAEVIFRTLIHDYGSEG